MLQIQTCKIKQPIKKPGTSREIVDEKVIDINENDENISQQTLNWHGDHEGKQNVVEIPSREIINIMFRAKKAITHTTTGMTRGTENPQQNKLYRNKSKE